MSRNITRLKLRSRQGGVAAQSILCRICCPKNGLESELQPAALPLFVNIFKNISTTSSVNVVLPKIKVEPTKDAKEVFDKEEYKPKQSPGHFPIKQVTLPKAFLEGAEKMITERNLQKNIQSEAKELYNYLWNRKAPIEDGEYEEKSMKVEQDIKGRTAILEPFLSAKQKKSLEDSQFNKTKYRLKRLIYHWEPIQYNQKIAFEYLVGRTPAEYATLYRIFYELAKRDPDFKPTSLFDFGSGIGSVVWAANQFWRPTLKEHMLVDTSEDISYIADVLFRRGSSNRPTEFTGIFYRKSVPSSAHRKYDLIVSSNSLLELSSVRERIEIIDTLWKKTETYLVLTEVGSNAGFKVLAQARDYILQVNDDLIDGIETGHVFSPCPHEFTCPRIKTDNTPCNFKIGYNTLMPFSKPQEGIELFSYVVFKKGLRKPDDNAWPRIVRSPLRRPRHVICRLCTNKGILSEVLLTKAKSSKELYRTARKSQWGDLLPVQETQAIASDIEDKESSTATEDDNNGDQSYKN